MSLEASHIRFAYALKDIYHVSDLNAFISGSIYPDSRYITKISRELTHPMNYLTWDLNTISDFQKGWHTHLLCDDVQGEISKKYAPSAFEGTTEPHGEVWIKRTAIKTVQDIVDIRTFDVKPFLACLDHVENPNHEDIKLIERYNRFYQMLYSEPIDSDLDHLDQIAVFLHLDPVLRQKLNDQIIADHSNPAVEAYAQHAFEESIGEAKRILSVAR